MARQNIVNAIPMDALWDPTWRVLDAARMAYVDAEEIRERLRSGNAQLLIADLGSGLVRVDGPDAFALWKNELLPRLVSPEKFEEGFTLEDYPDHYCYVASVWEGPEIKRPTLLFEKYH
jgi:hypothetical protein